MAGGGGATAFVFAGGGSLGAVQVGMLHALIEAGEMPDFLVGSSVGALNAAWFAGAPDLAGVERLAQIWTGLRRADIFPLSLSGLFGILRRQDNIADPGPLRRLLETHLAFDRIEGSLLPLHIMATDQQGVGVRLSSGPAVEAILASAAVPGIFPPVTIGGRQLMDGAIAANTPSGTAASHHATLAAALVRSAARTAARPRHSAISNQGVAR